MKKIFAFATAFALFAAAQAFAIAGFGAHYLMNTGNLKSDNGVFNLNPLGNVSLEQGKSNPLRGVGFKLWLDFLPFVDIEGTFNMAFATYSSTLNVPSKAIPIEVDLGVPFYGKASPVFSELNGDISFAYPFTMIPIIRPYLGAGISYIATTPVVNSSFTRDFFNNSAGKALVSSGVIDENQLTEALTNFVEDKGMTKGWGGHLLAGLRVKAPVIPIAVYVNGKYYFGGNLPKQFSNGFVLELGGGFAL